MWILRSGPAAEAVDIDGTGQAGHRGEPLGLAQRPLQRPVAAHRQPGDEGVVATGRHPEERTDELRELLGQERPVAATARLVGVEAAMHLGHDHRQTQRCDVPLDRGAAQPDRVVIAEAMQQVQHRRHPVTLAPGHADPRRGLLRQDHGHRRAQTECLGEEVTAQMSHEPSVAAGPRPVQHDSRAAGHCRRHVRRRR